MFDRALMQWPRGVKISEGSGKWQLASEFIQHEFIFIQLPHCSVVRPLAKCSGRSSMYVYVWENAHWPGSKSNTRGSEFTPPCSPTSGGHPTHKLGQGLSGFRCTFLGSPEIRLSDLTGTQRKAFRVQVWLHQYCVNGPLSGQRDFRKDGEKGG